MRNPHGRHVVDLIAGDTVNYATFEVRFKRGEDGRANSESVQALIRSRKRAGLARSNPD
jgi:Holliday junction resolvase